jgi:hypothetical protein
MGMAWEHPEGLPGGYRVTGVFQWSCDVRYTANSGIKPRFSRMLTLRKTLGPSDR